MNIPYHECNWFGKLLRLRHYILVPFNFIFISVIEPPNTFTALQIWEIAVMHAQLKMNKVVFVPLQSLGELFPNEIETIQNETIKKQQKQHSIIEETGFTGV